MSQDDHDNPSEVDHKRTWFDEFAARAQDIASRDIFFIALVVLTVLWAPTYFLFDSITYWYIAFILPAEIITLLLVALLENSNRRSNQAMHRKLDAIAEALAAVIDGSEDGAKEQAKELRAAVGLQDRESTDD